MPTDAPRAPWRGLAASVGAVLWLTTTGARADDPPPVTVPEPVDRRVQQMGRMLAHFEQESNRYRTTNAWLNFGVGAASVPAGVFILSRHFALAGTVLVARGGFSITSGVLDLAVYRQPFEELRGHFLERTRSGLPADEVLAQTQREWVEKAKKARSARLRSGVLALGVGAGLVGFGATVGIANLSFPSSNVSSKDRASFVSLLVSFGSVNLASGLRSLLIAEPIEAGWQSYTLMNEAWWRRVEVNVAALPSGALASLGGTF